VVLVSGYLTARQNRAARGLGAFGLVEKPVRGADLAALVRGALDRAATRRGAAGTPAKVAAAEALLHTLARRLADSGGALEAVAREMRGPLAALLEAGTTGDHHRAQARRLLALVDECWRWRRWRPGCSARASPRSRPRRCSARSRRAWRSSASAATGG
jgi:FixJ family two-component response regulator